LDLEDGFSVFLSPAAEFFLVAGFFSLSDFDAIQNKISA
jgi:hypothetical protein